MRLLLKWFPIIILSIILLGSCTILEPFERVYVNDPEMNMGTSPDKAFENYYESIREGSVSATGQKGSGGCGCN